MRAVKPGIRGNAMTITLYQIQPSPHAREVRLLAAELGIPLNKVPVDPRTARRVHANSLPRTGMAGRPPWRSTASCCGSRRRSSDLGQAPRARAARRRRAKTQALVDQWICWWVGGAEAAMDALARQMLIKPKVLNEPGFDPGIMADARALASTASCPCSTSRSKAATT